MPNPRPPDRGTSYLPADNLLFPVLISAGSSGGSGFYFNTDDALYLATARHVLFDPNNALISKTATLTSTGTDHTSLLKVDIDCEALIRSNELRPHKSADVAICKIAKLDDPKISFLSGTKYGGAPNGVGILGIDLSNTKPIDQVTVSNTVFLFGYPMSLANPNIQADRPLLRRGIVAGKTANGKIVIDVPVYFGNSGGLVVEVVDMGTERTYMGVGIAVELVPFVEQLESKQYKTLVGLRHENSGYAIVEPFDRIRELL